MKYFFLFIIIAYILLSPFYIFESGLPQPADFVIAFGCLFLIFSKDFLLYLKLDVVKKFIYFLSLTIFINIFYFLFFKSQSIDASAMLSYIFYYSFNFLFFLLFLKTLQENPEFSDKIAFTIIFCLIVQTILAVLGINGGIKGDGTRSVIFFNNPNQLGYFALLMLTIFITLKSKYKQNFYIILLILVISASLILFSGSRAALGGFIILSIISLYQLEKKYRLSVFVFVVLLTIATPIIYKTTFIQDKITLIERRGGRNELKNVTEAQVRGYDRFWLHPEYIFFGAGEGKYDRFDSWHSLEIHSGFGTVLFSYGIFGLILFSNFIFKVISNNLFSNILLLLPVIIYNATHQGLRFSLLWALLAIIYAYSNTNPNLRIDNE